MNPEKDQDRVFDTTDHFNKFGYVMFPEQRDIYRYIVQNLNKGTVLEAGCGMGLGAYLIDADVATDKLEKNVKFAEALYPYGSFDVWDITQKPYKRKFDIVVCVETVEHVENIKLAIKNLIASANKEVWISTPNRSVETPDNPYHVREYSKEEMLEIIGDYNVNTFEFGSSILYHIIK